MKGTKKIEISVLIKKEDDNLDALLVYGERKSDSKNQLLVFYSREKDTESYYDLQSILTTVQLTKIVNWIEQFHPERFKESEVDL